MLVRVATSVLTGKVSDDTSGSDFDLCVDIDLDMSVSFSIHRSTPTYIFLGFVVLDDTLKYINLDGGRIPCY